MARQVPPRFDVAVSVVLPPAEPLRLAQQIRQDMWRAVQAVRGFSPVVKVEAQGDSLLVTAGGRVAGRVPGNLASEIKAVLEDEGKAQPLVATRKARQEALKERAIRSKTAQIYNRV